MKKTKIDWCDSTANPVIGCPNGCEYCYGRAINCRFHLVSDWNKPEFDIKRLKTQLGGKRPRSVFIDSMSDIGTWKVEWLKEVIQTLQDHPRHKYIALTKLNTNTVIDRIVELNNKYFAFNCSFYIGKSVTTQKQADILIANGERPDFISIEPLLEPIITTELVKKTHMVIIGAETGTRKEKVVPKKEWVDAIVRDCDEQQVFVFMKESLRKLMGKDFRQDKLLWSV